MHRAMKTVDPTNLYFLVVRLHFGCTHFQILIKFRKWKAPSFYSSKKQLFTNCTFPDFFLMFMLLCLCVTEMQFHVLLPFLI